MKQILTTIGVVVIMALGFAEFSMSSRVIIYDETEMNTPSLASQWTTAHYEKMESKYIINIIMMLVPDNYQAVCCTH